MLGRRRRTPRQAVATLPAMAGYSDFRFIGSGGFSRVYTARQERFARTVAVKVITVDLSADALRRFGREQATAGRLDGHPHVIRAYESGFTEAGQPYLTMEYHERGSLADRLRREGPLPAHEVLSIGVKLACALDAAHRRGVVHRDVKPQNVLVSPFVGPVLADFGIAAIDDARLHTLTGEAFTALHVAPEVLEGLPATPSGDLYSLASTLYELVAGYAPFAGDGDDGLLGLMRRVRSGAVPPIGRADVPGEVADALVALLARDPRQRPPTGVAFAERLRQVEAAAGWEQTALVADGRTDTPTGGEGWPGAVAGIVGRAEAGAPNGGTEGPGGADGGGGVRLAGPDNGDAPGHVVAVDGYAPAGGHGRPPLSGVAGTNGYGSPAGGLGVPTPPTPPLPEAPVEATITRPPVVRAPQVMPLERPSPRRWRRPAGAAAAALLALAGGTAWWLVDRPGGDEGERPATTGATSSDPGAQAEADGDADANLPPCPTQGSFTAPDQPLVDGAAPTTLELEVSSDATAATLRWDDPNGGRAFYVAYVSCDDAAKDDRRAVGVVAPGEAPQLTVDGLSVDFNYCFTVGVWGPVQVTAYRSPEGHSYVCLDQTTR